jgi:predicted PolB exonuclease-like 3'-5' exonuclease
MHVYPAILASGVGTALPATSGAKIKLDEICKIIGLPGKPSGIDGGEVEAMVNAGRIAEVAQYCESDVLNTYRLWFVYELFRGTITAEQLAFSEAQAAEFVQSRKSDNPHLIASVDRLASTAQGKHSTFRAVLEWLT